MEGMNAGLSRYRWPCRQCMYECKTRFGRHESVAAQYIPESHRVAGLALHRATGRRTVMQWRHDEAAGRERRAAGKKRDDAG